MPSVGGRRRNLGSDRWISYHAIFGPVVNGKVTFTVILSDDVGHCGGPTGVASVSPAASVDEIVRAAVHAFIDSTPVEPGKPPDDPLWALKHVLRGGRF